MKLSSVLAALDRERAARAADRAVFNAITSLKVVDDAIVSGLEAVASALHNAQSIIHSADATIVAAAVKAHARALQYEDASDRLREKETFLRTYSAASHGDRVAALCGVKEHGWSWEHASDRLRADKAFRDKCEIA